MNSAFDAIYRWDNKMKAQIISNIFHLNLMPLYYNNLIGPFSSLKIVQTIVSSSACWKILKKQLLSLRIFHHSGKNLWNCTCTMIERFCTLSHSSLLKYLLLWNSRTENCENHTKEQVSSIGDKRLGDSNPWEREVVIRSTRSSVINCL